MLLIRSSHVFDSENIAYFKRENSGHVPENSFCVFFRYERSVPAAINIDRVTNIDYTFDILILRYCEINIVYFWQEKLITLTRKYNLFSKTFRKLLCK